MGLAKKDINEILDEMDEKIKKADEEGRVPAECFEFKIIDDQYMVKILKWIEC